MNNITTLATADREDSCTGATNSQVLRNIQIVAGQQNGSTQTRVKRDRAFWGGLIDGIAQRTWPSVIERGDKGWIKRPMQEEPTGYPCCREQKKHDDRHIRNRAHTLCSTGTEKCYFVSTRGVATCPCLCFFQLGATIETISGLTAPLPFYDILANDLLERDVI